MVLEVLGVRGMSQVVKRVDAHVPKHKLKLAQLWVWALNEGE